MKWTQFGLRSLLVAMTLSAIVMLYFTASRNYRRSKTWQPANPPSIKFEFQTGGGMHSQSYDGPGIESRYEQDFDRYISRADANSNTSKDGSSDDESN